MAAASSGQAAGGSATGGSAAAVAALLHLHFRGSTSASSPLADPPVAAAPLLRNVRPPACELRPAVNPSIRLLPPRLLKSLVLLVGPAAPVVEALHGWSSCWPSICCSHEPLPSGDIFPPLLVSSLPISHILCCSFVLLIWERTEEGIICHLWYCFALMWPLISVAVVQASCFLVLPLMVVRLQYAPISCLGCAVIFK